MTTNGRLDGYVSSPGGSAGDRPAHANGSACSASSSGDRAASSAGKGRSITDAAASAVGHGLEAGDYLKALIEVQQDRAGLAIRRKITQAGILALAACVGATCLITATLLVIDGLADGLTVLFGGRAWLGNLVAGGLLLGGVAGGVWVAVARRDRTQLSKQVKKYEQLRNSHRARHGRHVADPPATDGGSPPGLGREDGARGAASQFE